LNQGVSRVGAIRTAKGSRVGPSLDRGGKRGVNVFDNSGGGGKKGRPFSSRSKKSDNFVPPQGIQNFSFLLLSSGNGEKGVEREFRVG